LGTVKALKDLGIRVPEDISIIGFDNLPAAAMSDPALTTIEVSKDKIGNLAVELLYNRINAEQGSPSIKMLVSGRLVERSSVKDLLVR